MAELIIIVTANQRQMNFISDGIVKGCRKKFEIEPHHTEGRSVSGWILIDYGFIVINIMSPKEREYYNLEKLWFEGKVIEREII